MLIDGFRKKFGDISAGIINYLALLNRLAAVQILALHQRAARGIDLNLQRYAQFFAITQNVVMNRRQACRTGIEVVVAFPVACLDGAVGKLDFGAVANGPTAAAGAFTSLEHDALETCLSQLIGG